jgi:amino acid permease
MSIVAVSCIYGAIVGALTFWCPTYLAERLTQYTWLSEKAQYLLANIGFAVIVLISSICGTGLGAILLDKVE